MSEASTPHSVSAAIVREQAFGHVGHLCNGYCPDYTGIGSPGLDSRDPECFYCSVMTVIDGLEEQLETMRGLLREAVGWMEGVEPKPAAPFLAECRTAVGSNPASEPS